MTANIVALDPGLTIGICILHTNGEYEQRQLIPTEYPHPHETVFDVLSEIAPRAIIFERFDFRAAKNGAVLTGVEFIGVIELYAQVKCIQIMKMSPSDGKAFWNDNKLRALNMYRRGLPHANDATRILNTYRMKNDSAWREWAMNALKEALI